MLRGVAGVGEVSRELSPGLRAVRVTPRGGARDAAWRCAGPMRLVWCRVGEAGARGRVGETGARGRGTLAQRSAGMGAPVS